MSNKAYYAEKAKYHFEQYQLAVERGDEAEQKRHMAEYLNYDKASK